MVECVKALIAGKPLISTTDWPSKVCCVIFFVGCNLRCRFCFNSALLEFNETYNVNLTKVYQQIEDHQYLIDGVLITGGEPTLQPNPLFAIAEWSHNHDLEFGLMTNGTKPNVIKELLDATLLDYVALDIKTIPSEEQYAAITQTSNNLLDAINQTITLLKSSKVEYEFRTTLVPGLVDNIAQLKQIIRWVGKKNYVLQNFCSTKSVLDPKISKPFSFEELDRFREFAKRHQIATRF